MLIELSKRINKYTIKISGCYWTAIDLAVRLWHKAATQFFEKNGAAGIEL